MNPTILNFPTLTANPSKVDWKLNRFDARNTSPLSGTFQDIQRPGTYWSCSMSWDTLSYSDSQQLAAWSDQMSAGGMRTYLPNFAYTSQSGGVFVGAVNGANQTGASLILNSLPASTPIAQTGDFFNVSNGTQHQLLRVTSQATTDSLGNLTINFVPALRFSPTNGSAVTFGVPAMVNPAVYKSDWQGNQLQYSTPRTNLLEYSQDLTQASWVKNNITVTSTSTPASSGDNFCNVSVNTSASYPAINQTGFTGTVPLNSPWSALVILRAATNTQATLVFSFPGMTGGQFPNNTTVNILSGPGTVLSGSGGGGIFIGTLSASVDTIIELSCYANATGGTAVRFYIYPYEATIPNPATGTSILATTVMFCNASSTGSYIKTTTSPVTVTDYTLTASQIVFASAPAIAAALTLKNGSSTYQFGTGNGTQTAFDTGMPLVAFAFAKPDSSMSYTAPRIASFSLSLMEDTTL